MCSKHYHLHVPVHVCVCGLNTITYLYVVVEEIRLQIIDTELQCPQSLADEGL